MFIIIIGTRASGKSTVLDFLVHHKGFKRLRLNVDEYDIQARTRTMSLGSSRSSDLQTLAGQDIAYSSLHTSPDNPESFLSMSSSTSATFAFNAVMNDSLSFTEPNDMLLYVTRNWRDHFVTDDIATISTLEPFLKRPFVLLVSVDAPTLPRFYRHGRIFTDISLEQFLADDDRLVFGPNSGSVTSSYLFTSYHLCHVNVINNFDSVEQLHDHLEHVNLLNIDRLRPSWDSYFMKLASLASHRSNCMKRRVGAILVRDHAIIATGYNGTPRGIKNCNEGGCKRCNEPSPHPIEGFEECLCIHAEENALLECGRERVGKGAVLYCNTCPCLKCTIKIVQTGVAEVVYNLSYKMDASSTRVLNEAGVKIRHYSPPN